MAGVLRAGQAGPSLLRRLAAPAAAALGGRVELEVCAA